ncbi:hypothetical protein F4677DRAFT_432023 [Hypoxylon crocopeplum]|nr:hypothetical protein F4677DRAFT_432023 [Hypoxylon crocopeplum]
MIPSPLALDPNQSELYRMRGSQICVSASLILLPTSPTLRVVTVIAILISYGPLDYVNILVVLLPPSILILALHFIKPVFIGRLQGHGLRVRCNSVDYLHGR